MSQVKEGSWERHQQNDRAGSFKLLFTHRKTEKQAENVRWTLSALCKKQRLTATKFTLNEEKGLLKMTEKL